MKPKLTKLEKAMRDAVLENKPKSIYAYLHELGHLICGWSCCTEHAEFEAHGAAKVIAKVLGLDKFIDWKKAEKDMACYAKWSSKESCGRYKKKRKS